MNTFGEVQEEEFEAVLEHLKNKCKDDSYAQALYASLCNVDWHHKNGVSKYGCTWRYAGSLVAYLRGKGEDYLAFYCSGMEGKVRRDIFDDLEELGWTPRCYGSMDGRVIETDEYNEGWRS